MTGEVPHSFAAYHSLAGVEGAADVVGLTIAEFIPRQVIHLRQILTGFPLVSETATD